MTYHLLAAVIDKPSELPGVNLTQSSIEVATDFMIQLAAILSLIFILIGAVKFSVSGGDPQKVASARNTLIYSIIGLIVSISAFTIAAVVGEAGSQAADAANPIAGAAVELIDWLEYVVGAAAVIGIIYGGIRYITSAGQPQSAQAARNTIIYSIVGLIVALMAEFIVSFVL